MASSQDTTKKGNKYFQWSSEHDVIMCREVLVSEPFNFKPRSPERGKVWDAIAQRLNAIDQPKFRVSARAVRDRYSLLTAKQAQKLRDEEKASGIHVEISELDSLLEEILEREKDGKAKIESQDLDKNRKAEKEKATAEEVRKQAMERMADTKKRENDESDKGNGKKKGGYFFWSASEKKHNLPSITGTILPPGLHLPLVVSEMLQAINMIFNHYT
ncbi:uncharacterized protein [Montipora foliosa]|uniref:uncharacterized protein isoform X2 n=1 Tax=Montipora foliosa TaxID=591990 RepID=UPI0035F1820D